MSVRFLCQKGIRVKLKKPHKTTKKTVDTNVKALHVTSVFLNEDDNDKNHRLTTIMYYM